MTDDEGFYAARPATGYFPAETSSGARLDEAIEKAVERGEHLWAVITTYHVTDAAIERAKNPGQSAVLDSENLLSVSPPGCLVCEQLHEDAAGTPCPGEPTE